MSPASTLRISARVNQRASVISAGSTLIVRPGRPPLKAQHQRARERPRLAGHVVDAVELDADLFHHLAGHRGLGRLARLDVAGQAGEPAEARRPVARWRCCRAGTGPPGPPHRRCTSTIIAGSVRGQNVWLPEPRRPATSRPRRWWSAGPTAASTRLRACQLSERHRRGEQAGVAVARAGGRRRAGCAGRVPGIAGSGPSTANTGTPSVSTPRKTADGRSTSDVSRHDQLTAPRRPRRRRRRRSPGRGTGLCRPTSRPAAAGRTATPTSSQSRIRPPVPRPVERRPGEGRRDRSFQLHLAQRRHRSLDLRGVAEDHGRPRRTARGTSPRRRPRRRGSPPPAARCSSDRKSSRRPEPGVRAGQAGQPGLRRHAELERAERRTGGPAPALPRRAAGSPAGPARRASPASPAPVTSVATSAESSTTRTGGGVVDHRVRPVRVALVLADVLHPARREVAAEDQVGQLQRGVVGVRPGHGRQRHPQRRLHRVGPVDQQHRAGLGAGRRRQRDVLAAAVPASRAPPRRCPAPASAAKSPTSTSVAPAGCTRSACSARSCAGRTARTCSGSGVCTAYGCRP